MQLEDAVEFERSGRLQEAADRYEGYLQEEMSPIALANLLVLYWQVTDFGFWTSSGLTRDFAEQAGQRLQELLQLVQDRFPNCAELEFWRKYIRWIDLGEPLSAAECQALMERSACKLPVLILLAESPTEQVMQIGMQLAAEVEHDYTVRGRYIASVLQSSLRRVR